MYRTTDSFIAFAYPPFVLSLLVVAGGLMTRRLSVRAAELWVLFSVSTTFLLGLAVAVLTAENLPAVRNEMTVSSLLTINLMVMLAYVALETPKALRFSLAVFGTFVTIVLVRLVPEIIGGRLEGDSVDYFRAMMFLAASVGLLHALAQVKEQAA